MIRFLAAIRTAVLVLAWLAGAPILLTAITGPPLPRRCPTVAQIDAWL